MIAWWLAALGCGASPPEAPPSIEAADCGLTWSRDAKPVLANWCTPCHSSAVPEAWRQGAPLGVDFDTLEGARAWGARIVATTRGEGASMPPAGGLDPDDLAVLTRWLDCGAPGEPTAPPVDPCAEALTWPAADAAGACSEADAVVLEGDLDVTAATSLPCVCAVSGAVQLAAPFSAPALREVGGSWRATGDATWETPALSRIGGDVDLTQLRTSAVRFETLGHVGGAWSVSDAGDLRSFEAPFLRSVGGPITLARAAMLREIHWPRLAEVGGGLVFEDLPSLTELESLLALRHVPGDLVVRRTGVVRMDDLRAIWSIEGDLVVDDNESLQGIRGLWELREVGAIHVHDAPQLRIIAGFDALEGAGGLWLSHAPGLSQVALPSLSRVGALHLESLASLPALDGLGTLREVSGALTIHDLLILEDVTALHGLQRVGGDLTVTQNPALPAASVDAWVGAIPMIDGQTVVSENGP